MQYFYWRAPTHTLAAFNGCQSDWIFRYNTRRLHGGLDFITPLEKLKERTVALANLTMLDPDLEALRIKFLRNQTIFLNKQDRQIQQLEVELTQLLKEIA